MNEVNNEEYINPYFEKPWSKYYKNNEPLSYPDISIFKQFEASAAAHKSCIAYEYFDNKVTYEEMLWQIRLTASAFKNIGVKKGEIVTICMTNTPEAIVSIYALNMIGAVSDIIHPGLSQNEIKRCLINTGSNVIVVADTQWDKVSAIKEKTKITLAIVCSESEMMPAIFKLHYDLQYMLKLPFINREFVKWSEFLECGATDFHADEDMESGFSEELAIILHSGGTTGTPKGIMLTNGNVTALSVQSTDLVNCFGPGNKVLGILPVFHGFGLIFCVHNFLAAGGTVAIITRFKPELFELYLITHKPNIIAGVPTLFRGLISNIMPGIDLSFVQMMVCGGDNLSDELRENIISYFNKHNCLIEIREGYGLTESVAGVTITPPKCPSEGIGSVGIPYKDMLCQVVDTSTGNPVPVNTPGELLVSGPTVMKGYFNSNAENENIFSHKDGRKWLHTGDIVSMDENGFFHYIQRLKRMIITSGYNVYPSYIEGILHKNPYIEDAAVVGIPHPYKGEVAKAYIVLAPDIPLNEKLKQSIIRYCKKNLPFYSVPAKFLYVSALPRTAVGKTDYKQL